MARNPPPYSSSSEAPPVTTETFQKHYGRGSGYPADPSRHGHHPPPPPPHHYPPSQYSPGQHAQPPYPPPAHNGHGYHPPPGHHQSWYYPPPPRAPAARARAPSGGVPPPDAAGASSSRRGAPGPVENNREVPPTLVTPKSHDSETLPPVAADAGRGGGGKKPSAKSNKKGSSPKNKGLKEKDHKSASSRDDKEAELEEEPKVEPMKQDFHFYAADRYEEAKRASRGQLDGSPADGSLLSDKENDLYLLTTLINARLVKDWEAGPPSLRAAYLKREESDRKRFMGEEEVASRHCATLTARRRSPKQSEVGRMGSFGLTTTAEQTAVPEGGGTKRPVGEVEGGGAESAAKRVRAV